MDISRLRQPRCFLVYALAPEDWSASEANQAFNDFVGDADLPLVLFHDHFIGRPGGLAVFYAETEDERNALANAAHLSDWRLEIRPLIYSRSPAAFDEQIRFTLRAYRGQSWQKLRDEERPTYGDPRREVETAEEDIDERA